MSRFASSDFQANLKFERYKSLDPFPEIYPALLNSADISDYVAETGMIHPFDPEKLGPASYEMDVDGEYLYWDEAGKLCQGVLSSGEEIKISKNSITYVTVSQKFRLPDYIALRFNFRIKHVHRGLLLGTGPLIDPGFQGKLMIPIHNLTSNDYTITQGDELISVEFTKISQNQRWGRDPSSEEIFQREGQYKPNSMRLKDKRFKEYLRKALPIDVRSIESSLPEIVERSRRTLDSIEKWKKISIAAIGGFLLTFGVGLVSLYISTCSLISDANKNVSDASSLIRSQVVRDEISSFARVNDIEALRKKIEELELLINNGKPKAEGSKKRP